MRELFLKKLSIIKTSIIGLLLIDVAGQIPLDVLVKAITQLIIGGITIYKLLRKDKRNEQNKKDTE